MPASSRIGIAAAGSVDAGLVPGRETDDDGVAAVAVQRRSVVDHPVAGFDHQPSCHLAVEAVVDAGVADDVLLRTRERQLVGLDDRNPRFGQGLERRDAGLVVGRPPDVRRKALISGTELLLHLGVLLGLIEVVLDDGEVVAELGSTFLGTSRPLGDVRVRRGRDERDDRATTDLPDASVPPGAVVSPPPGTDRRARRRCRTRSPPAPTPRWKRAE